MRYNIILDSDGYKPSHAHQYPEGMTFMQSYVESRGGTYPYTVFFGLQGLLKERLLGRVLSMDDVEEAEEFFGKYYGRADVFDKHGWMRIVQVHGGRIPILIRALPEGTVSDIHTPLLTVESTDPEIPWIVNYLETMIMRGVWYPTTVATLSRACKSSLLKYALETGDVSGVPFRLHDFGARGVASYDAACVGGAAHLVNFLGSDTLPGIAYARAYYGMDMAGFSIPATEHSTITTWGTGHELDAFKHWLDLYPTGIIACVSDSYDLDRAVSQYWGKDLHDQILMRDGVLVVRPDSGEPTQIVPRVLTMLWEAFGGTVNEKGFRVLNPKVRVIQGDGINPASLWNILEKLKTKGWSADNVAFGMGGGLLQQVDRDVMKFAMKCNRVIVNGEERAVYKQPKTDSGKASKGGYLSVHQHVGGYLVTDSARNGSPTEVQLASNIKLSSDGLIHKYTRAGVDLKDVSSDELGPDLLVDVYRDGELLIDQKFDDIRDRASMADDEAVVLIDIEH